MLNGLNDIREIAASRQIRRKIGVAAAHDLHTLEAVVRAAREGIVEPILYGQRERIIPVWEQASENAALPEIVEETSAEACVAAVIQDVRSGQLECVMKGSLETGTLMKGVVQRDTGIRRSKHLSLIAVMESPFYHKVFAVTDVGLMTYPDLEQKKAALLNAVSVFHKLGVENPKVAVLAAVEKVNSKMPDSVDAKLLREMFESGEIQGCVVEGPISYDLCMDPASAAIKSFESPVAGDPDILLVPDIVSGNLLAKSLTCTGGAKTCGTVCGAQVPIVITSRAATAEDKYMSIVLAAAVGRT